MVVVIDLYNLRIGVIGGESDELLEVEFEVRLRCGDGDGRVQFESRELLDVFLGAQRGLGVAVDGAEVEDSGVDLCLVVEGLSEVLGFAV
jgi:hypothetical protein